MKFRATNARLSRNFRRWPRITSHLQEVWNGYLKSQGIETGGSQTENPAPRTIYIGPEAYGLFTMPYTSAQGMENTANNAPIKLRLIYTMIK